MIPWMRLVPGNQWDQTTIELLLDGELYPHRLPITEVADWPNTDGLILVIPGRYWAVRYGYNEINTKLARYSWVLAIRTSDEEDLFDPGRIIHDNIRWWIQTPRADRAYGGARLFGCGVTPHMSYLPADWSDKPLDVFLAAQNTHPRRWAAFAALEGLAGISIALPTEGFTQGMSPAEYAGHMLAARVAPAPSGPASPDSFRLWEALAAHAIPIADDITPHRQGTGYWGLVAPGAPFPVLADYGQLQPMAEAALADWPRSANRVAAWWIAHKRTMSRWLIEDLRSLGATEIATPTMSVIVTASPIKSHPDTHIIEETISTLRSRLPNAEIILAHDGVRTEQEYLRPGYEEYLRRILWLADHDWHNTLVLINDEHLHQGVTVKRALQHVDTPLVMVMEHDTPLQGDIPWDDLQHVIQCGAAHVIRLHHEASILPDHMHLMMDTAPITIDGVPLMRSGQWSQRPHLASTAFYRALLADAFAKDQPDFIEDVVYGKLCDTIDTEGLRGWDRWRTWIYAPEGDMKRSYHTDGRAGESKFGR